MILPPNPPNACAIHMRAREDGIKLIFTGGKMRERTIEGKLVRRVREMGGLCYKFVSPNNPGVPDRLVIMPGGKVIFVELKTESGRLSAMQKWQLDEMGRRGADVRVLKGLDEVLAFAEGLRGGGGV